MRNFRDIQAWEKAHQFALGVYKLTSNFPKHEEYGLSRQIRRSASSIPTNIAEGCGRNGKADLAHFLDIALGSAKEADYQLLLSKELGYLKEEAYGSLFKDITEIQKMLSSLIAKVRSDIRSRSV